MSNDCSRTTNPKRMVSALYQFGTFTCQTDDSSLRRIFPAIPPNFILTALE